MHARCQSVFLFALSTSSATDRQAQIGHGLTPTRRTDRHEDGQSRIHTHVHGSESKQSEDPWTSALIRDGPVPRLSVTTRRRLMLEPTGIGSLDVFGARRGAVQVAEQAVAQRRRSSRGPPAAARRRQASCTIVVWQTFGPAR